MNSRDAPQKSLSARERAELAKKFYSEVQNLIKSIQHFAERAGPKKRPDPHLRLANNLKYEILDPALSGQEELAEEKLKMLAELCDQLSIGAETAAAKEAPKSVANSDSIQESHSISERDKLQELRNKFMMLEGRLVELVADCGEAGELYNNAFEIRMGFEGTINALYSAFDKNGRLDDGEKAVLDEALDEVLVLLSYSLKQLKHILEYGEEKNV